MEGNCRWWSEVYTEQSMRNLAFDKSLVPTDVGPGYAIRCDGVFSAQGMVSFSFNLVPPEYLGPGADTTIPVIMKKCGFGLDEKQQPKKLSPFRPFGF